MEKDPARMGFDRGIRRAARILFSLVGMSALSGCAIAPDIATQGARLVVSLQFADNVNPIFHYFFLVRNSNDPDEVNAENGPIPIFEPPYGNGFATGQNTATAGFTDFVVFNLSRQQGTGGFGVYKVPGGISGNPNNGIYGVNPNRVPDVIHAPTTQSPALIRFEIGLCSFAENPSTCNAATGQNVPRFLQVNMVATTTTPISPTTVDHNKYVDAFGEQRLGSGTINTFIQIDTATANFYQSSQVEGDPRYEPDNDTYPQQSDPAIELIAWSIQVIPR